MALIVRADRDYVSRVFSVPNSLRNLFYYVNNLIVDNICRWNSYCTQFTGYTFYLNFLQYIRTPKVSYVLTRATPKFGTSLMSLIADFANTSLSYY